MARPTKEKHEKRSGMLPIRLTLAERAFIEEQATKAGTSISGYLRDVALNKKVTPPKSKLDASLLMELNRIGVNLNQLTHAANIGRTDESILRYALEQLVMLMRRVDEEL